MTDDNDQGGRPKADQPPHRAQSSSSTQSHSYYVSPPDDYSQDQPPGPKQARGVDNNLPQRTQDRPPPLAKSQSSGPKLGLFRKSHRGSRSTTPSPLPLDEDEDDEWLLEGMSNNGQVNATVSVGREASTFSKSVDTLSLNDDPLPPPVASSSQERPEKRRGSKGRSLAKKTSRLFHRSTNGHSNSHDDAAPAPSSSGTTLPIPLAGRHSSFSSTGSGDTSTSRKSGLVQAGKGSPKRSQLETQPSSWHPPPTHTQRRASSSTQESSETSSTHGVPPPHPLRHKQSGTNLNSSAPSWNRHSAPPRAHGSGQQYTRQETSGVGGRMSSWVSNIFNSNDNSSNNSPSSVASESTQLPPSPLRKGPSAAASFFSGVRNKAVGGMRYLLDSDAQPDQCQETMWVMGVAHPGWTPDEFQASEQPTTSAAAAQGKPASPWMTRVKDSNGGQASPPKQGLSGLFSSSFNLAQQAEPSTPPADSLGKPPKPKEKEKELKWPQDFHDDFRSRVWCTYRSQYAPILPLPQHYLLPNPEAYYGAFPADSGPSSLPTPGQMSTGSQQSRQSNGPWGWVKGDERGLTSDSGWGCMLRTGQSMLANALISVQLGRDWRLPSKPSVAPDSRQELSQLEAYAKYVQILSWFLDDPSPLCPFSVHRMALIGKELGKEVGEWFGPSTAAGALKTLANSFPICGLSVATAVDGTIYRSDVYAASHTSSDHWTSDPPDGPRSSSVTPGTWGDQAVLILIGIRLGLDGVNPLYYDSIKTLFTFPQSVGIAGGRPSSSYYFVASQANSLFYLDPHFTRPAVPLRVPPLSAAVPPSEAGAGASATRGTDDTPLAESPVTTPVGDLSGSLDGSSLGRRESGRAAAVQASRAESASPALSLEPQSPTTPTKSNHVRTASESARDEEVTPSPTPSPQAHTRTSSLPASSRASLPVDQQTAWYANAYSEAQLQSFHCDRVKKLPLSGMDPSMLLGFLCTSEAEFDDFCDRVAKLPQKIFVVQDELPTWSDDEDGALESVSEPVSGPELSDDESGSSERNVSSVLAAADEVDEFGRITSRPTSPGQTIVRSATPSGAFSTLRKPPRDEFELIASDLPVEQRPDFERTVTARPAFKRHSRGSSERSAAHSRGSSLDLINVEMPVDPRPEVERSTTARPGSDAAHSRGSSVDYGSGVGGAPPMPADEDDDIEMLRPESSDLSSVVDEESFPRRSYESAEVVSSADTSFDMGDDVARPFAAVNVEDPRAAGAVKEETGEATAVETPISSGAVEAPEASTADEPNAPAAVEAPVAVEASATVEASVARGAALGEEEDAASRNKKPKAVDVAEEKELEASATVEDMTSHIDADETKEKKEVPEQSNNESVSATKTPA